MNARRLILGALCVLGVLAFAVAPALAAPGYKFSFGGEGTLRGGFEGPVGLAVDDSGDLSRGDVYVIDQGHSVVDEFTAAGAYIGGVELPGATPNQLTVDDYVGADKGNVYVAGFGSHEVYSFAAGLSLASEEVVARGLPRPTGVAVDEAGDFFVSMLEGEVWEYNASWQPIDAEGTVVSEGENAVVKGAPKGVQTLAVSAAGEIYLASNEGGGAVEYTRSGKSYTKVGQLDGENSNGVTVAPSGNIFVDQGNGVAEYEPSGTLVATFGSDAPISRGYGVAVNSSGNVYVADYGSNLVDVFGGFYARTVPAGELTRTTAKLHAKVTLEGGGVVHYHFDYGPSTAYGSETPEGEVTVTEGDPEAEVAAAIAGLKAAETYHYKLVATDTKSETAESRDAAFTTSPAVEGLSTLSATALQNTSATLNGSLEPNGFDTHYYFEYGTTTAYGSTSPAAPGTDAGSASKSVHTETTLAGLTANTVYHYRLVGVNSLGTTYGQDATLTTPGAPTIDGESIEKIGSMRAILQAQITPDGRETTYYCEYGETQSYGHRAPVPAGDVGSGEQPVSVLCEPTGLKASTTYHYRVLASNEYGTEYGSDQTFTTEPPVLLEGQSVSDVAGTSATLRAQVNPLGSETTVYAQYGTVSCTASPASCVDAPSASGIDIGSAEGDQPVSIHLQDLAPSTTYYYRVVASNALGTAEGPDQTFTTQAAGSELQLLDDRAWEMVTPADKQGAQIYPTGRQGVIQAAADGDAFSYVVSSPTEAEPQGAGNWQQVFSSRGPGGWSSRDIDPPTPQMAGVAGAQGQAYRAFSSDMSHAIVNPFGSTFTPLSPEASEQTSYLRTDYLNGDIDDLCTSSCYRPLVTGAPGYANVPPGTVFGEENSNGSYECSIKNATECGPDFVDATPDLSHVVVESQVGLTPESTDAGLFEWSDGSLKRVSLLPEGTPAYGHIGSELVSRNAISNDGTRVIWSTGGGLYMRDMVREETFLIGGVNRNEGFEDANVEGSKVFFDGEVCEVKPNEATSKLECPVVAQDGHVLGISEDGSYVYFVSGDVLSTVANGEQAKAVAGGDNLYLGHDGTTTFIATLSPEDEPSWRDAGNSQGLETLSSRVSPNGLWLAFMSSRDLTGYDTHDALREGDDEEVYLYDASTNRLACPSCEPTGALPVGNAYSNNSYRLVEGNDDTWYDGQLLAADIPGWSPFESYLRNGSIYQSRYLSNSGRLFFNSFDALVSQDVNGQWDVYEYEPPGEGTCRSSSATFVERSDGCVDLVSSGTSAEESAFLDASESGGDVFFLSAARLAPQDLGRSLEVYDAHECTAQAPCVQAPTVPPPCTTGDACKPAPTPQPALYGAPSSETFSGAGNVVPLTAVPALTRRSLTRARKLAKALKACHGKRAKSRALCERRARKRYGAAKGSSASRKGRR